MLASQSGLMNELARRVVRLVEYVFPYGVDREAEGMSGVVGMTSGIFCSESWIRLPRVVCSSGS